MDSRSPSPVAQIQMVHDPLPSLTEDQPNGRTGRQKHSQPQFDSYVGHLTDPEPERIDLTKDSLSEDGTKLREDMLNHRPSSPPKPVIGLVPVKMLERPPSTGGDLNSGFSYQKATMPAMDFSRFPPHKPSAHKKPDESLPKQESQDSAYDRPGSVGTSDSVHIKSRDFDMLAGGPYPSSDRQITSAQPINDPVKRFSPPEDILPPFPGSNLLRVPPESYHESVAALAENAKSSPDPMKSHGADMPNQDAEPGEPARTEPGTVDKAVLAPAVRCNKVTKAKQNRRPQARRGKNGAIVQPDPGSPPSEADLLNLLAYRYKKDCESKANREASLQAKNLEVEELRRNQGNLERYLAESERNVTLQEKELGKYKEAISKKVGKLTKFVNGLAKDHNQLRNDAKLMLEKQNTARADGIELTADIRNARALAQEWARKSAENPGILLRDARQKIDQLEEVVRILNRDLEDKSGLLATERDRTVELEAKIKLAAGNHDEVKALMDSNHTTIIEKLDILPDIVELAQGDSVPGAVAELRIKVEECLGLLKTVHSSGDVLPEVLHDSLGPVRVACGEILASVQQATKERRGSKEAISTLEASLKEDLHALKEGYNAAQSSTGQLVNLRESQAALMEKLRGKDMALSEAQERCVAAQNDRQSLLSRISALEAKAAASPRESEGLREALNTLQKVESANAQLESDLATARREVADLQDELRAQAGSAADLQSTKDRMESEIVELQASVTALEQHKLMAEQESVTKSNEIRKELAASSKHAREMVVQEYGNKLHQLTERKKEVDAEVEQLQYGLNQYKAQVSKLREKMDEKDISLESLKEQLRLAVEKANTRDAEIQAIREDRTANAKVLRQEVKKADALQRRVVSLTELNSKFEGEGAALRAKFEKAEKLHERVAGLYRAVGLGDSVAPLSIQMVDLLEERVLALKNQQSLSVTKTNPETHITTIQRNQLPEAQSDNTKRPRRKVTRHASTDNRNIREVQTPIGPGQEREFSVVETRLRETTVEVTSFISSQGTGAVSEPPIHPYEIDSTPAALVQETQTTDSFVPLWDIEAEAEHVPTSPFTDLSDFFPTSPLSSPKQWASPVREEGSTEQSTKSSARKVPSDKDTEVTSKDKVQTPSTPRYAMEDVTTNLERKTPIKGQSSKNTLPPSQKMFSPAPDFSSPSTDHIGPQNNSSANTTSNRRTVKRIVKNENFHKDNETEARPAKAQSQATTKLPLTYHSVSRNKNKPTGGRVATRSILKNPNPTTSKKRGLEGAEMQANNAASVAKRPKREGRATTGSQTANAPPSSTPKPPLPIPGRTTHQHPYSPTAKKGGTSSQRHRRSQTSEGDSDGHRSR